MQRLIPNNSSFTYRPDIDGLRAIAILLVLRFHFYSLKGGFTGVDIFFVISGYLITGILLGQLAQTGVRFYEFYAKRIRRIFPALVVVLLSCLVFGYAELFQEELQLLGKHIAGGAAYISNFVLWQEAGYFTRSATTKPLLHLWSLGIEEQFYFVWPALILLASRWRNGVFFGIMGVLLASFIANIACIAQAPEAVFYLPFTRCWELAIGGLLAYFQHTTNSTHGAFARPVSSPSSITLWLQSKLAKNIFALVGFACATMGVITLKSGEHFPGWGALLPTVGAALMIAAGPKALLNRYLLGNRLMIGIGKISYPLYLWHWPVFVFSKALFGETSTVKAVAFVLSFVLAWLTYQLIEKRFKHLNVDGARAKRTVVWGVVVSLLLVGAGLYTWKVNHFSRMGNVQAVSENYDQSKFKGCIADGNPGGEYHADAFNGCDDALKNFPANINKTVLVIGDSHAYSLYQGLLPLLEKSHVRFTHYSVTYCPPLSLHSANKKCSQYNQDIQNRIAQLKPEIVVLFGYYTKWAPEVLHDEAMPYANYLQQRTQELLTLGVKKVIVVGHVPTWEVSLPYVINNKFLRQQLPFPTYTTVGLIPESLQYDATLSQIHWPKDVAYFSLKNTLCNAQGCRTNVGEQMPQDLMVYDYGHMTAAGASYVVQHGLGTVVTQAIGMLH